MKLLPTARGSVTHAALVLAAALSLTFVACTAPPAHDSTTYTAVIDAGSSGTRVHLYKQTDHVVTEIQLENDESDIPLASFEQNTITAGETVIAPLLSEVKDFAAANKVELRDITVHVLGTAGMRKIDDRKSDSIYADAGDAVAEAGFAQGLTETITGNHEALYAWADANDLNGTFVSPGAEPVGIVEVGGASAQIAFALSETFDSVKPHVNEVTINQVDYQVFSYSYLGLGQNDARNSMLSEPNAGVTCYPNSADVAQTFALTETFSLQANQAQFDYPTCTYLFQEVISETSKAFPFDQVASLPGFETTKFYGLSSIAFAAEDFEADPINAQSTLETRVAAECSGPGAAERVSERFSPEQQTFALHACANGTYISTLLDHLSISHTNFIAGSDIQGQSPSWTRGFAVLSGWQQVGVRGK